VIAAAPLRRGEVMPHGSQEKAPATAPQGRQVPQAQVVDPLSGREREVLLALVQGFTPKQIAGTLGLAEGTVRSLLARSYIKLGVHTWRAAVRRYRRILAATRN
jgi:DNA-binding NarL/FixJ family response regulator